MDICRACMSSSSILVDIFCKEPFPDYQCSFADMVNEFVDFKIIQNDEFPQKMCEMCCLNVQVAFEFKLKFEQSQQVLRRTKMNINEDPLEADLSEELKQNISENLSSTSDFNFNSENNIDVINNINENGRSASCELLSLYIKDDHSTLVTENELDIYFVHTIQDKENSLPTDLEDILPSAEEQRIELEPKLLDCSKVESPDEKQSPKLNEKSKELCKNADQFNKHLLKDLHKCTHCPKFFPTVQRLRRHLCVHNNESPFKCSHCTMTFKYRNNLKLHMRTHTGERPYKCNECQQTFRQDCHLKRHMRKHTGERPYMCDQCPKTFIDLLSFKNHTITHTSERPHKCSHCEKDFKLKTSLRIHMRTHTGERPYKCEECSATFAQLGPFTLHKRIHTSERPYKCVACCKTFNLLTYLKSHMNTHTGERPFKCSQCDKAFANQPNLYRHIRTHNRKEKD